MTVSSNGSAIAFEHFDADAAAGTTSIVPALQAAVDAAANRPQGGKVTVGTYTAATVYPWIGILDVPPNVTVEGVGLPKIQVTSASSRLFRTDSGAQNVTVRNFDIAADGNVATAIVDIQGGFDNVTVENLFVTNGTETTSAMDVVRISTGEGWVCRNVNAERARYLVWNGEGANEGRLVESSTSDILENGGLYRYAGGTRRTWVQGNRAMPHLENVTGGHMIQGDGEANGTEEHELWITDNLLEGRAGVAWDAGIPNGGAADMIAIRNTKLFHVARNTLRFGGEFGITAVHGSRHGVIEQNLIEDMDGSAISLGSTTASPPRDVDVMFNHIRRPGLNAAGNLADAVLSAIHVREADECNVWMNRGWQCPTYGLYIHADSGGVGTVTEFTHGYNLWKQVGLSPVWDQGAGAVPIAPNWTRGDYSGPDGNVV